MDETNKNGRTLLVSMCMNAMNWCEDTIIYIAMRGVDVMIIIETQKDDIHAWMKAKIVFQERKGMDWITKDELSKKTKHELMQIIAKTQWQMKDQKSGASAYDDDDDEAIRRDKSISLMLSDGNSGGNHKHKSHLW
eukprot:809664_1